MALNRRFFCSDLSEEVKSHIRGFTKEVPNSKVLFIKQDRSIKSEITSFVVVGRERGPHIYRTYLNSYEDLLGVDIPAMIAGQPQRNSVVIDQPLFLVCTHGRHDKCCSKYGFPIFKAVRDYAGASTWQVSHVGGDRFAANVVCFPHDIFYGNVTQDDVKRVVDDYRQGRVYLNEYKYRGRACYARAAQVAEFFVRSESGITDLDDLSLLDASQDVDEQTWRVRFGSNKGGVVHQVVFASEMSEFQNFLTCGAEEEKSVAQYKLIEYSVTSGSVGNLVVPEPARFT